MLSESFDRIARVIAGLDHADEPNTLTIACAPALAAIWLLPEMAALMERHPGISLEITSSQKLVWLDDYRDITTIDANTLLADANLAADRLVAPFATSVAAPGESFILCPQGTAGMAVRDTVATWLADRLTEHLV